MESINFVPPNKFQRELAIGSLSELQNTSNLFKILKKAETFHQPKNLPGPDDWLASHKEIGQTYNQYLCGSHSKLTRGRKTLYINPLSEMDPTFLSNIVEFCSAFFHPIKIKLAKIKTLSDLKVESRINPYHGKIQYNAGEINRKMAEFVPNDAHSLINILNEDIYPKPEWNYVFGLANYDNRVGVFSFARYNPLLNMADELEDKPEDIDNYVLYRACKILAHEASHTFGLRHCIFYECLMNGINHINEFTPLYECPVCLRKLQSNLGFEPLQRYKKLHLLTQKFGGYFQNATEWYEKVISTIENERPRTATGRNVNMIRRPAVKTGYSSNLNKKK